MAGEKNTFSIVKLNCTDRPIDRYISVEAEQLITNGQDVILVSAVEIANRWQTAIDLGNEIRQTFVKQYRTSPQRSVLTKFESALKTINRLLDDHGSKIAEPIHCALAIFSTNQLYFATINNGHILLCRKQKISQISGPHLAGERFASVTSGDLKKGDWVVIGSLELRNLLKNSDPNTWDTANKSQTIKELVEGINPEGYDQLAGITVEPSSQSHVETVKLSKPFAAAPKLVPNPDILIGKVRHRFKLIVAALGALFARRRRVMPEEPAEKNETATPPIAPKRFPYRGVIAGVVVLALILTGVGIIRGEFRKVSKKPVVTTPTIASLLTTTPPGELFSFIEQNLTVDNFQGLSEQERTAFTQTLQTAGIGLITATNKVATFDSTVTALDTTAKYLYAIDGAGALWRYDSTPTKVASQSVVANPISLVALADNKIVASDQAGQLWLFDGSADQPHGLLLPAVLTQGPKLLQKFGSSNLYLYPTASNAVYKVGGFIRDIFPESQVVPAPDAEPPAPPTPTITSSVLNFGTLADWAVPSDFIGVTEEGVIKNFTKNKLENLNIQYYKDNATIHLSLTSKDGEIAVARGKLVSIFSTADGHKTAEYALVTDQMVTDISPGPGGILYAAAGKNLFKIQ